MALTLSRTSSRTVCAMALPSMISAAMARGIVARDAWDRRARRAVVPNGGGDEDEDDEDGREVNRRATSERARRAALSTGDFHHLPRGERDAGVCGVEFDSEPIGSKARHKKMTSASRTPVRSRDGRDERMDE